jgi:hypothetical protein
MTFDQIVNAVMDRQNLSSATALARVQDSVNERYRWLRKACGLQVTVAATVSATTVINVQVITFRLAKVRRVFIPNLAPQEPWVLNEQTMDYMRNTIPISDPPQNFARYSWNAQSETLMLDSIPATAYLIYADGDQIVQQLEGNMIPSFPEDYHDALIYGAMEIEYRKKGDNESADKMLELYTGRRNELIQQAAISAYLQIYQNKSESTGFNGFQVL